MENTIISGWLLVLPPHLTWPLTTPPHLCSTSHLQLFHYFSLKLCVPQTPPVLVVLGQLTGQGSPGLIKVAWDFHFTADNWGILSCRLFTSTPEVEITVKIRQSVWYWNKNLVCECDSPARGSLHAYFSSQQNWKALFPFIFQLRIILTGRILPFPAKQLNTMSTPTLAQPKGSSGLEFCPQQSPEEV